MEKRRLEKAYFIFYCRKKWLVTKLQPQTKCTCTESTAISKYYSIDIDNLELHCLGKAFFKSESSGAQLMQCFISDDQWSIVYITIDCFTNYYGEIL